MPRQGGELRGNNQDRRRRKLKLIATYGDGHTVPCVWCSVLLNYDDIQCDRIDPTGTYRFSNVLPACRPCNETRSNKPAELFVMFCATPDHARTLLDRVKGETL